MQVPIAVHSSVILGWSYTDLNVLDSNLVGQASVESCIAVDLQCCVKSFKKLNILSSLQLQFLSQIKNLNILIYIHRTSAVWI